MKTVLTAAAAALLLAGVALAQEIPADPVFRDFVPLGDFALEIDGAPADDAAMYRAQSAGSVILIVDDGLPGAVLLSPRDRTVQTFDAVKVVVREGGTADVLSDASMTPVGEFTVEAQGAEVRFAVGGQEVRLKERPYLLGSQDTAAMLDYNLSYRYLADQYKPSGAMLRQLRSAEGDVKFKVYFGTWCPYCKEMVPRTLKLAEELAGSGIEFEYYGLPKGFGNEPAAARDGVTAVPTGILYRDGQEIGRLSGADWKVPELAIKKMLDR